MRLLFAIITVFTLPAVVQAQQHHGRVYDALSNEPLGSVLITNTHGGALWLSDSSGNMVFTAFPGDVVRFSHPGYKSSEAHIAGYNDAVTISLQRAPIELKGVEVLSPMARYKQDSVFNHQFFHKELGYAHS